MRGNSLCVSHSGLTVSGVNGSLVSAVQKDCEVKAAIKVAIKRFPIEKVIIEKFESRSKGLLECLSTALAAVGRKVLLGVVGHDPIGDLEIDGKF